MTNTATPLSPDARLAKIAKITALLCKTQARGASAEEETAAKAMADRLCAQYDIKPSECVEQTQRRPINTGDFWTDLFNAAATQPQRSDDEKQREARMKLFRATGRWDADWGPRPTDYASRRPHMHHTRPAPADQQPAGHRKNTSHKFCDHEATSSARARCRKNRGF